jgi:hypothetical protein
MSLESVLNEKTIKNRYNLLSKYINCNVGELNETEQIYFKHIFSKFYTPDDNEEKYNNITNVKIIINETWKNKCFNIQVDNTWIPASIKRLAGSNRNNKMNLRRALRNTIEQQIMEYRTLYPLKPNDICPITSKPLNLDAQVDHLIPFHVLADRWLETQSDVKYNYDLKETNYVLELPQKTQAWYKYHQQNAKLRWVSKEGNKYAHKNFILSFFSKPSRQKDRQMLPVSTR